MNLDDQSLDRLIRATQADASTDLPSEDVLRRYLLGTASKEERHQVREALERSAALRRQVLELAEAVDHAIESEQRLPGGQPATHSGSLPTWLLARMPAPESADLTSKRLRSSEHRWSRIFDQLRLPILAPLAAAAVLVILLVARAPHQTPNSPSWQIVGPVVATEELIPLSTRSSGAREKQSSDNEREAAVAAFRNALRFNNGEFVYQPPSGLEPPDSFRLQTITLTDSLGSTLAAVRMIIPNAARIEFWILTLPARALRKSEYRPGARTLIWNPEWSRRGCITFVYQQDSKFASTMVQYFEF